MNGKNHHGRTAVLVGATGLIGTHLLQCLLEDRRYREVRVLVRRPTGLEHNRLATIQTDFSDIASLSDALACDDWFCCLGTTMKKAGNRERFQWVDCHLPVQLAEKAVDGGAQFGYVVSALGAKASSRIFYNRVKGEMEQQISSLLWKGLTFFRPSLLVGERKESRPGEKMGEVILNIAKPVLWGSLRKYRPIQARDVAKAMQLWAHGEQPGIHRLESDRIQAIASA